MQGDSELDKIIKSWATAYNEEVLQYSQPAAVDDSEVIFLLSILIKLLLICLFVTFFPKKQPINASLK